MSNAFGYALVAALGNVVGALAVTRRAARELALIEHFVAFGAGFMLAVALVEVLPEAFARSGTAAPALVLAGYLAVHFTQHTLTPHFHFGEETHAVNRVAGTSALVGLLLHTFFDGVAIASAFLVRPALGVMVFIAIFLHKLPEGVTVSSLMMAGGRSGGQAIGAAAMLGAATLAGVALTDQISFLIHHGLALSAGVTIYVAASNLVPEFQGKRGWTLPTAFFAGAATFYVTKAPPWPPGTPGPGCRTPPRGSARRRVRSRGHRPSARCSGRPASPHPPRTRGRPERDPQAANELLRGAQSVSLRHVRGYRYRGASDLIHQSEMPVEWGCHREPIRCLGELLRHPPSVQLLQLSHRAKIEPRHAFLGTSVLRTGHVFAQHVSRFPFPLSRV